MCKNIHICVYIHTHVKPTWIHVARIYAVVCTVKNKPTNRQAGRPAGQAGRAGRQGRQGRQANRQANRQTDRRTDERTDRQTDGQTDKQTDRQIDKIG